MKFRTCLVLGVGLFFLATQPTVACLWDRDTLAMERERFPDVIELITGKFLRHSRYYYEWRVKECEAIIESGELGAPILDDLAVSYEKLGDHGKAIEVMLKKEKLFPGLYETYANLGTFYIHNGEYEKGIEQIDRAIAINPDAHFGREVYQKLLVQYVLERKKNGRTMLPLKDRPWHGFAAYVLEQKNLEPFTEASAAELEKARKGVLGMMRFGNYDSPILLEALANLLLGEYEGERENPKRLATCALLKASYESEDEPTRKAYRNLAEMALQLQTKDLNNHEQLSLEELEAVYSKQLAEADTWYGELEDSEQTWASEGKDVGQEFDKVYSEEPRLSTKFDGSKPTAMQNFWKGVGQHLDRHSAFYVPAFFILVIFVVVCFCVLAAYIVFRLMSRQFSRDKPPISSNSD